MSSLFAAAAGSFFCLAAPLPLVGLAAFVGVFSILRSTTEGDDLLLTFGVEGVEAEELLVPLLLPLLGVVTLSNFTLSDSLSASSSSSSLSCSISSPSLSLKCRESSDSSSSVSCLRLLRPTFRFLPALLVRFAVEDLAVFLGLLLLRDARTFFLGDESDSLYESSSSESTGARVGSVASFLEALVRLRVTLSAVTPLTRREESL